MVLILHEDSPLVMSTGFGASGLGFALTASAHRASDKLLLSSLDLSFLICELGMVMVLNARTVVRRNEGVEERRPGSAGPCPIAAAAAPVGALPCLSTEASLVSSHLSVENLPPSTSQHRAAVGFSHSAAGGYRGLDFADRGSASTCQAQGGTSDTSMLVMGPSPPGSSERLL